MHVNVFDTKTDEELVELYNQFIEAEKICAFPDGHEFVCKNKTRILKIFLCE